ncbi:hypothetical protein [Streptomyces sp. L-9-10]|uniref:hypothetical protein n=1 Tax=Streptomyces sp. L-9-10 TaxID=1478131 RepID=UPI001F019001|nr:hypothetical protein [Streptomyces sp. L-9-10]
MPAPAHDTDTDTNANINAGTDTDAALWITLLARQFPDLLDELAPGRATPTPTPVTTPGRPAPDARLRAERRDALRNEQVHGLAVPGHSAAPLRLYVSDAIRDITDGVVELDEAVHHKLGLPRPRRAQVPERLLRIAGLLDRIAAEPVLARHVRDEARRMARRCARTLGDTEPMVRVNGRCPWCDSVSLRAFPSRQAVLCVNPACRCGEDACDCAADPAFRHSWEAAEWAALAEAAGGSAREMSDRVEERPRQDGHGRGREGGGEVR